MKQCQAVALVSGVTSRVTSDVTAIHRDLQKPQLFAGFTKIYQPKDEEGDSLPAERQVVQLTVEDQLKLAATRFTELLDVNMTRDSGNTEAFADVVVNGRVLISDATVPFLLFFKKQLEHWRTIVSKLPLTDPSEVWSFDAAIGQWRTEPSKTSRSRKVLKNHVMAEATDRHPAQVQTYTVDEPVGTWTTTRLSGAVHEVRQRDLLTRVNELLDAVKIAVEEANQVDVEMKHVGKNVFDYLLAND